MSTTCVVDNCTVWVEEPRKCGGMPSQSVLAFPGITVGEEDDSKELQILATPFVQVADDGVVLSHICEFSHARNRIPPTYKSAVEDLIWVNQGWQMCRTPDSSSTRDYFTVQLGNCQLIEIDDSGQVSVSP